MDQTKFVKMSIEEQEQSHSMDEDRQHPRYNMPKTLKKVAAAEGNFRERLRRKSLSYGRQLQKVPPVLRLENESTDYDPMVVALGPYQHGKKKLQPGEKYKIKALQHIIVDTGKSVQFFFDEIIERIPLWFLKLVMHMGYVSEADDLVDAFIYQFSDFSRSKRIEIASYNPDIHFLDACRRVLLSECDEWETTVSPCWTYVSLMTHWIKEKYGDESTGEQQKYDVASIGDQQKYDDEPTGQQEKYDVASIGDQQKYDDESTGEQEKNNVDSTGDQQRNDDDSVREQHFPRFHSASDLKGKGIQFRPSRDSSLMGLHFKSGYYYAQLQLPILHVSTHTKVFFSNLIAYESCPESPTERKVTAYIEFMKSLIVHANDVKELREKGILFTPLGSDEEVVKMFKELKTSTLSTEKAFEDVRVEIEKHFRSKFKTWQGEFLYTYFRSPWAAIGTIAAIILLLLTLAQTYFAIRGS